MEIRIYDTSKDYYTLCKWWSGHKWAPVSPESLPSIGFIVDDLAAGFLYKTDSDIAILEFIISNPDSDKEKRKEALDKIIKSLKFTAKELGFKSIFTSCKHPSLISKYEDNGFQQTDLNMTNMIARI